MEFLPRLLADHRFVVDAAVYLLVFGAVARAALSRSFPGREGRILAVAVGAMLALALLLAQKRLGFTMEKLGPVALLVLGLAILSMVGLFLHRTGLPTAFVLLLTALVGLALAQTLATRRSVSWIESLAAPVFSLLIFLIVLSWLFSEQRAAGAIRRRPGQTLARSHYLPSEPQLADEVRLVRRRTLPETRHAVRDEHRLKKDLHQAGRLAEKTTLSPKHRKREVAYLEDALRRTRSVREAHQRIVQLVAAVEHMDVEFLHLTHRVDLRMLTPDQRRRIQEAFEEERRRIRLEEHLKRIDQDTGTRAEKLESLLVKAAEAAQSGNQAAVLGWQQEARPLEDELRQDLLQLKRIERRILQLLRRQIADLSKPAGK